MTKYFKLAIFALALTLAVGASAEGYMFNTNLKYGMRSDAVKELQMRLGVTPATGYFGKVTLAAVKNYQTTNSISPVSGYVGPLTRTTLNSGTTVVPGTTVPPVTTLTGQEGYAEYRLSPQPVNDTNIQRSADVAVYGLEVKAKNSDVNFERVTLNVLVQNGSTYENPATLINKITVKDGSTVLATVPVTSSSFSKVTGYYNYTIQLSGLSAKVAKDTIKTLTVYFDVNSIESSRTVSVSIDALGARVVDGRGISTYNSSAVDARTHIFKKAGNSTLTVKQDATTIYATNYRVNALSNGTEKALTSTFAVKSESGDSKITDVQVTVATSTGGTMPTNAYLYQGSTLLDARTIPTSGVVVFDIDNSNVTVSKDTTSTFTVKVDMPSTTVNGSAVKTTVNSVIFDKADGSSATVATTVAGPYHFFATVIPEFTKVSSTASTVLNNNINTSVTANVKLNIKANGGDILVASTTAVIGLRNIATGAVLATTTVTGTTESGLTYFADGATKTVEFTANFASTSFSAGTTNVKTFIQSIKYATSTGATWFNLTEGFEPFDSDGYASFSK